MLASGATNIHPMDIAQRSTMCAEEINVLDEPSAEEFVLKLLRERGPMSTMEIEKSARKEHKKCPDQTVLFLAKMKKKGLIMGEASIQKRGWLWWVP
jgi:hypothetical protein